MKNFLKILLITLFYIQIPVFANSDKNNLEKVFTPVGWGIGAAIAPVYLGGEYAKESVKWTGEHVFLPVAEGTVNLYDKSLEGVAWTVGKGTEGVLYGAKYTVFPVAKGIFWGGEKAGEYVLVPMGKGMYYSGKATYDYVLYPSGKAVGWTISKGADGLSYGIKHSVVPIGKGLYQAGEITADYVIIPVAKGVGSGVVYVAVPTGKAIKKGAKYTIVPIGKGIGYGAETFGKGMIWSADKIGDGVEWSADKIIYPIGYGIGKSTDAVVVPISRSVKATSKATKRTLKNILHKK